ncbi:DNA polymerase V, subunit C [Legionella feeleii]|uniref:DNA polymerase V, subunit C n=1 Tax=Legionella feeleii TaxID=453 RepID=A0A378KKE8_9GAMM|nr:DNA polymerase V, subunit C [Legionella feeleii]
MDVFDTINGKFGRHAIKLAAEGTSKPWAMRAEMRSPCYTTQWSQLPLIRNGT